MPELQRQRSRTARYMHYCRLVATFLFSHIGLGALVIAYSTVGAAIFQALEEQHERDIRREVEEQREIYAEKFWDLSVSETIFKKENWSEKATSVLNMYEDYLLNVTKQKGFDGKDLNAATRWGFMGALLYSLTMITTIGYGDRVPRTRAGKIGTIIYAVAGIPLMFIFLMNIGNLLARSTKYLYWRFCKSKERNESRRRKRRRRTRSRRESIEEIAMRPIQVTQFTDQSDANRTPIISNRYVLQRNVTQTNGEHGFTSIPGYSHRDVDDYSESYSSEDSDTNESDGDDYKRTKVPIRMCVGLLVGYSLIGAKLFSDVEGWDFFISIYFCFQTLTTIGFGDYVPGDKFTSETETTLILVACALYLIFGLGLVAMTLTLIRDSISDTVRKVGQKIGIIKDDSDSE